jgi:hypothetical protein
MPCDTCLLWTGRHVEHAECPIKADLVCRRCCGSGHTTSECDFAPEIHPTHLEELIPHDVRERYGITTRTEYVRPPVPVDPHPIRCIEIINQDKWIRDFMKHQHLSTARKREENLARIMEWAAGCGLNIRLLNQEP